MLRAIFAKDSTTLLIKKYLCYKLMSSNLFINSSLSILNVVYKILGIRLTNFAINKSVGQLFTSGESIQTLIQDINALEKNNIYGIGMYVVEGLHTYNESKVQEFFTHLLEVIHSQTEGKKEGHLAIKLTALISTDIMTRMSRAQQMYLNDILKFNKQETIDISDLRNSLLERGIQFEEQELIDHFNSLKFSDNTGEKLSQLEIYANAHLFRLDEAKRTPLMDRIMIGTGVGLNENDL
jgi:hypothetical protein